MDLRGVPHRDRRSRRSAGSCAPWAIATSSARPRHYAQAAGAIEHFKKASPRAWAQSRAEGGRLRYDRNLVLGRGSDRPEEQDHRRWAKRGTRPCAPHQRTASTYIFGAVCPKEGKGAALILPTCNTEAMNLRLVEIAADGRARRTRRTLGRSGWLAHVEGLVVPPNITIMALPPKCPELNPVENVWQFLRDNWLSNRVFKSYDDLVDHCCVAWNKLVNQPWANHVHSDCANGRTGFLDQWRNTVSVMPFARAISSNASPRGRTLPFAGGPRV